jgi:dipeptidyl aminopeptidase/acylaminoacyl peptidase
MDDESLRAHLHAAGPLASPDDAQLAAIRVRAERLHRLRNRQAALGVVVALALIAAGSLVALRGHESKTKVEISSPTTSSSPTGNSAAPETTVVESTTETTATESAPAVAESPTTALPPFGDGGGKLLYTSASDTARQGLSATNGNGTENAPIPLPDGVSDVSGPQWSPDRSKIAFASGTSGIWIMSASGTGARQLTTAFDMQPVWSPDGASIAVRRLGDTSQIVIVSVASGQELATAVSDQSAVWAPDSSAVAFIDHATGQGSQQHQGDVYVLARSGGTPVQITNDADTVAPVNYFLSDWEPNGRLTYGRYAATGAGTFTARADGSDVVQLIGEASVVRWSRKLLAAVNAGRNEVRIVTDHGATVASVAAPDAGMLWSPDGSTLAIAATDGLSFVRSNGSTIARVDGFSITAASWSPDGQLLAGIQNVGPEGGDLVVVSIDGITTTIGPYSGLMCCGVWVDW